MKTRASDYGRALSRTNLAIRCWLRRIGDNPNWLELADPPVHRVLTWLLSNHILQAFYREYGIDVIPFTIGGMYGYGMNVQPGRSCLREDVGVTARIACGSVRVDPEVPNLPSIAVRDPVEQGEDPLWLIDTAAMHAVGGRWPTRCRVHACRHRHDARVYLSVHQILTLLLCMGYASDAILGTYVECNEYGVYPTDPPHPLRRLGYVNEPRFIQDFFNVWLVSNETVWVHRGSGELVTSAGDVIPFSKWCGGDVDLGLRFLCRMVEQSLHSQ